MKGGLPLQQESECLSEDSGQTVQVCQPVLINLVSRRQTEDLQEAAKMVIQRSGLLNSAFKHFCEGQVCCSNEANGELHTVTERQKQVIRQIEASGNKVVWHIIEGVYSFPNGNKHLETYLLVGHDLPYPRRLNDTLLVYNYTLYPASGAHNYGDAIVAEKQGKLKRIA